MTESTKKAKPKADKDTQKATPALDKKLLLDSLEKMIKDYDSIQENYPRASCTEQKQLLSKIIDLINAGKFDL